MKILAIDTATDNAGLAVIEDGRILGEETWNTGRTHTTETLVRLDNLLKKIGIKIDEIGAVACANGPGSFNGLRVGISTAKGIALVRDLPAVGINTLDAIEASYGGKYEQFCVLLPAGRKEVSYRLPETEAKIAGADIIASEISSVTYFIGEIQDEVRNELKDKLGDYFREAEAAPISRVAMIGLLGEKALAVDPSQTADSLQAIYLKRPNITKPKKYHYLQEEQA